MKMQKFSLQDISEEFTEAWSPKDIENINDTVIRFAKFFGQYHWHKHDNEDELFIVFKGKIKIQTKDKDYTLEEGDGIKIPKGVEHCPVAIVPSFVLMLEPSELKSKGK